MTTWSSYQSLIQLAAALNFGFAGFEFLFEKRLVEARETRTTRITEMIAERKSGAIRPTLSAAQNATAKARLDRLARIEGIKSHWNAMLSVYSGIAAIFILGFMSFYAETKSCSGLLFLAIFVSYLWFAASMLWMLSARSYLRFFVVKIVEGEVKATNGKDSMR